MFIKRFFCLLLKNRISTSPPLQVTYILSMPPPKRDQLKTQQTWIIYAWLLKVLVSTGHCVEFCQSLVSLGYLGMAFAKKILKLLFFISVSLVPLLYLVGPSTSFANINKKYFIPLRNYFVLDFFSEFAFLNLFLIPY